MMRRMKRFLLTCGKKPAGLLSGLDDIIERVVCIK